MSSAIRSLEGCQEPSFSWVPAFEYSFGDDAFDLMDDEGYTLDEWQRDVNRAWLATDEDGVYLFDTLGLGAPRQNGKNGGLYDYLVYRLVADGAQIIYTAHEVKTAQKAFKRLCDWFEDSRNHPYLNEFLKGIRRVNGQEGIQLQRPVEGKYNVYEDWGYIEFSARSKGAARGFSADVVVFDEAQELTDEQLEALLPTLSAAPSGMRQMVYLGTPPYPRCVGEVFPRLHDQAHDGTAGDTTCWHEWGVVADSLDGIDLDDERVWARVNPGLGKRLSLEFTHKERALMSDDGFARERLGWWSPNVQIKSKPIVKAADWNLCETDEAPEGKTAFGIKFSPDGMRMRIAAAVLPDDGDIPYVELIDLPVSWGAGELGPWLCERRKKFSVVVIDGINDAEELDKGLKNGSYGAKLTRASSEVAATKVVISAASGFASRIEGHTVSQFGQEELTESVTKAIKRPIGSKGGWGWGGEESEAAEAASLALYGVYNSKRDPRKTGEVW